MSEEDPSRVVYVAMGATLPRELTALCSAAAVMLAACVPDSPGRKPGDTPPTERDAGRNTTPRDAGRVVQAPRDAGETSDRDGGPNASPDAGFVDAGHVRDGGPPTPMLCPPMGSTGLAVGNVIPDVQLRDCDGNPVSLHSMCERRASHLFVLAGW
jgi:hypothetical protein